MLAKIKLLLEYLPIIGPRLRKRRRKLELMARIAKEDPFIYE